MKIPAHQQFLKHFQSCSKSLKSLECSVWTSELVQTRSTCLNGLGCCSVADWIFALTSGWTGVPNKVADECTLFMWFTIHSGFISSFSTQYARVCVLNAINHGQASAYQHTAMSPFFYNLCLCVWIEALFSLNVVRACLMELMLVWIKLLVCESEMSYLSCSSYKPVFGVCFSLCHWSLIRPLLTVYTKWPLRGCWWMSVRPSQVSISLFHLSPSTCHLSDVPHLVLWKLLIIKCNQLREIRFCCEAELRLSHEGLSTCTELKLCSIKDHFQVLKSSLSQCFYTLTPSILVCVIPQFRESVHSTLTWK